MVLELQFWSSSSIGLSGKLLKIGGGGGGILHISTESKTLGMEPRKKGDFDTCQTHWVHTHFSICEVPQGGDVLVEFKGIEIELLQWAYTTLMLQK